MKRFLRCHVHSGAVVTVVVLVLVATIVTGRESEPTPEWRPAAVNRAPQVPPEPDDIDLRALLRQRGAGGGTDLFAQHSWTPVAPVVPSPPPTPAAAPQPPSPPEAPPLPFKYLGRMVKRDATLIYLLKNQELVVAEAGTTLEA